MKRSDFFKSAGALAVSSTFLGKAVNAQNKPLRIKPNRLKEGDTIGLVAPAGIIFDGEEFNRMRSVLEEMGFKVKFGDHVRKRHGYFSGEDEERAEDLNRMFADDEVNGIIAVRGGWGCARILRYLDFDMIRKNPKVYSGFSDNTTLHLAILAYSGLVTFHGPMGNSTWSDLTRKYFHEVLVEGKMSEMKSKSKVKTIQDGKSQGGLIGGNLSILTTSLGTPYQPDTRGGILFLEDIGESSYKIDRMLTHLREAGMMEDLAGFVFGKCTNCGDGTQPTFTLEEVLKQHIEPLGIPAIYGADISHEDDNFTLPMGLQADLNADDGTITLLEEAVK
ncbi:MAG: LD-carboxypeptidase [Balneolaceae bacterium]